MKFFELTTGFIAAVMIALGAAYYVNNSATVEEEPVVKESVTAQVSKRLAKLTEDCVWYTYEGVNFSESGYSTEIEDYQNYLLFSDDPQNSPGCDDGPQICAVCLPPPASPFVTHPNFSDFNEIIEVIQTGEPVSGVLMLKEEPQK